MNIQKHFSIPTDPEELTTYVSSFLSNANKISPAQIQRDFYKIDPQKIIDILSQYPSTNTLATILTSIKNQLIILGTNQQLENIISTTKDGLSVILINTHEPFFSKIFSFFSSKPSLNSFMKSVSLGLMAHLNQIFPPQKLYDLIENILQRNSTFFSSPHHQGITKETITNQLLLYYCINPENLKNYLDDRFSKEKYRPTTEEVDSNTTLKGWGRDFIASLVGRKFDQKIKSQIFQAVENQAKKINQELSFYQEYQDNLNDFFKNSNSYQNKTIAFETCMFILKEKNSKFKDFSLDQFIEAIKEMYTESPANFKFFLNQYFKENFSFYDQDLIDKTYQMIKKIKEEEDLEIELNSRIDYIKYNNNIISDMKNEEIKQALFQISQKDQTEKQDQKENTEKLPGVLVKLVPATKHQNNFVKRIGTLVQILSPLQKAA